MALKNFSTKQIIFLAMIGALLFVMDLAISTGIDLAVGIVGVGFLVSGFVFIWLATLGGLTVRKFGAYTLMALIYSALSIPTPVVGPPGAYKLLLGIFIGLIADIIVLIFRYRKRSYVLSLTIASPLVLPLLLWFMIQMGLPGVEELTKYFWYFVIFYTIQALISSLVAVWLYDKKISKMNVVRQISD